MVKKLKKNNDNDTDVTATKQLDISIQKVVRKTIIVGITGTSGLIPHRFAEKTIRQMVEKHTGKASAKAREPKDINANLAGTLHYLDPSDETFFLENLNTLEKRPGDNIADCLKDIRIGFPAIGFKKATVRACRNVDGIPMTIARGAFFIKPDDNGLVEVFYDTAIFREDMVRNANKQPDIRHRIELQEWKANITIILNPGVISPTQLIGLIDIGGFSVGIGDWRPEKDGDNGTYTIYQEEV